MRVAPTAFAAFCGEVRLSGFGKIKEKFFGFGVENLRADGNANRHALAVFAGAVRTFAVLAAFGFVFGVVTQVQQSIKPFVGFQPNITAAAAVTARRAAARHEFLAAKCRYAVAAVARIYTYLYAINEHSFKIANG